MRYGIHVLLVWKMVIAPFYTFPRPSYLLVVEIFNVEMSVFPGYLMPQPLFARNKLQLYYYTAGHENRAISRRPEEDRSTSYLRGHRLYLVFSNILPPSRRVHIVSSRGQG